MQAIIITIGDEILNGQTVDTNSAEIAKGLYQLGIEVKEIISISDQSKHIIKAVNQSIDNCEFLIITGGLGPTKDDITKKVLTEYFEDELVFYPAISDKVEALCERFNTPYTEINRTQAMLPKKAKIIENDFGTASGMWFKKGKCSIFSIPGVPYEMRALLDKFIIEIKKEYPIGNYYHSTLQVIGIGESEFAEKIYDWEETNRKEGINVSFLPSVGTLKLRLTGGLEQKEIIDTRIEAIKKQYPTYIIGGESETIENVIGSLLKNKSMSVGTVESCTGGGISNKIVSVSGSSEYYYGSLITYSNELKEKLANVNKETLAKFGAVSQEVVEEMAENGKAILGVDYCISISGIAGPDGGTEKKPVGTVWVAIATPDHTYTKKFNFGHNRQRNIQSSIMASLNFLRLILMGLIVHE